MENVYGLNTFRADMVRRHIHRTISLYAALDCERFDLRITVCFLRCALSWQAKDIETIGISHESIAC